MIQAMDRDELPTGVLTNYVIAEALGYINERNHHWTAVDLYERLKAGSGLDIVQCTKEDYLTAESRFSEEPALSFGDATLLAYA